MDDKDWFITIQKDTTVLDGLVIAFPDRLLEKVNWHDGDVLDFHFDEKTGTVSIWKVYIDPDSI